MPKKNLNKGQCYLAAGSIAVIWGTGSCMGSVMLSMGSVMLSCCRICDMYDNHSTICNSLAAICNANFDWHFRLPKSLLPVWTPRPLSNTVLLETTRVSLPNGISFCGLFLSGCASDRHTEHATIKSVAVGGIVECFQPRCLKIGFLDFSWFTES